MLRGAFELTKGDGSGGNIKHAIIAASKHPGIPASDASKLRVLSCADPKNQDKFLTKCWVDGIESTDRPAAIYKKLRKLNKLDNNKKIMDKILTLKKLNYLVQVFLLGATKVMENRITHILVHLQMPQNEIDKHVKSVHLDFGKVINQVNKDLALCQNESAIVEDIERALCIYIKSDSIEDASFYGIYMKDHSSRVQAAENALRTNGGVDVMNLKEYCQSVGICYDYQVAACRFGPNGNRGSTCKYSHECLWCKKGGHNLRMCYSILPKPNGDGKSPQNKSKDKIKKGK